LVISDYPNGSTHFMVTTPLTTCGAAASFVEGTIVNVSYATNPDYTFDHWEGDCSGSGSCNILMDSYKTVIAVFNYLGAPPPTQTPIPPPPPPDQCYTFTLLIDPDIAWVGKGWSADYPSCDSGYGPGDVVYNISVEPRDGWQFDHWSGGCSGSVSPCAVTFSNSNITVTAHLIPIP
jgi:hypothetical protein